MEDELSTASPSWTVSYSNRALWGWSHHGNDDASAAAFVARTPGGYLVSGWALAGACTGCLPRPTVAWGYARLDEAGAIVSKVPLPGPVTSLAADSTGAAFVAMGSIVEQRASDGRVVWSTAGNDVRVGTGDAITVIDGSTLHRYDASHALQWSHDLACAPTSVDLDASGGARVRCVVDGRSTVVALDVGGLERWRWTSASPIAIAAAADGGAFVLRAKAERTYRSSDLIRLDPEGHELWTTPLAFGRGDSEATFYPPADLRDERGKIYKTTMLRLLPKADGSVTVAGIGYYLGASFGRKYVLVVEVDASGKVVSRKLSNPTTAYGELGDELTLTGAVQGPNDAVVVAGQMTRQLYVSKL